MRNKSFIFIVITSLLLGLSFLTASASQMEHSKSDSLKITKICEIRNNIDSYVGKVVRVRGVYKTDHSFYSFILDKSCPSSRTIDVADSFHSDDESSVVDFFKSERKMCPVHGPSVCPAEIEIDAVVKICKQSNGKLFFVLKNVLSTNLSTEGHR